MKYGINNNCARETYPKVLGTEIPAKLIMELIMVNMQKCLKQTSCYAVTVCTEFKRGRELRVCHDIIAKLLLNSRSVHELVHACVVPTIRHTQHK
jgi:hypothetical protein